VGTENGRGKRVEEAFMTAFVLVAGGFTDARIWHEVADGLRESGAEAHPVTLTGMGDRGSEAGPGTDLDTHIADVLRVLDDVAAPEVVIVGHEYGIHPVLGAADRRPERIGRIVYLDAGMPQDGDTALKSVPDQEVHRRLRDRAGDDSWSLPAPASADEWRRWGSTDGLTDEALARLTRLASPQPVGTLTRPLRLSGAGAGLPTTGVLCTGSGLNIALVEDMVATGLPQFQVLARPEVTFFELATGHWPMLSCPEKLTAVLLAAAAGEGHRITATAETPSYLRPFALDVPERPRERIGRLDLYFPDETGEAIGPGLPAALAGPRPAVLFVHGGPVPADLRPTPRDWPAFVGHGSHAASLGVVGAVLDHRLHGLDDYGRAAEDIAEAVEALRADPRVDAERIALWYFSGGGLLLADPLAEPPSWLRCVAASYPVLAPLPSWGAVEPRFRPAAAVSGAGRLPVVLTRVGLENAEIAATVEEFLVAAEECGADVEVIDVPDGHHAFDTVDHTQESRDAVNRALRRVVAHLRA
jgi:dienelactone hydrolase/pimeloyl-ACP methyl ester carboxylesterase